MIGDPSRLGGEAEALRTLCGLVSGSVWRIEPFHYAFRVGPGDLGGAVDGAGVDAQASVLEGALQAALGADAVWVNAADLVPAARIAGPGTPPEALPGPLPDAPLLLLYAGDEARRAALEVAGPDAQAVIGARFALAAARLAAGLGEEGRIVERLAAIEARQAAILAALEAGAARAGHERSEQEAGLDRLAGAITALAARIDSAAARSETMAETVAEIAWPGRRCGWRRRRPPGAPSSRPSARRSGSPSPSSSPSSSAAARRRCRSGSRSSADHGTGRPSAPGRPGDPRPRRPAGAAPDARHAPRGAQPPARAARRAARPPAPPLRNLARPGAGFRAGPEGAATPAAVPASIEAAETALEDFLRALTGDLPALPEGPPVEPGELLPFQRPVAGRAVAVAARPAGDLDRLPGVGPGLIWALDRAGLRCLADLAPLAPSELAARLGPLGRLIPAERWIAAAREAAG